MVATDSPNVGVAFGLVIGAGAATALGAAVVFFPSLVKLASRRVLAGALGISAGVMSYVSFIEIFQKSVSSFTDAGHSEEFANLFATSCFFGGVILMILMDLAVRWLSGGHHHHDHEDIINDSQKEEEEEDGIEVIEPTTCVCCAEDPVGELDKWHELAKHEVERQEQEANEREAKEMMGAHKHDEHCLHAGSKQKEGEGDSPLQQAEDDSSNIAPNTDGDLLKKETGVTTTEEDDEEEQLKKKSQKEQHENKKLIHMGINTAIAIGLHNFPEGLATFVAALDDPRVGGVLAVAIGIHNVPEGLCVALPIYYATGNRWKAFAWACISGVSEPIAALLGWAVLANRFSDALYATLFGIVGGMMVIISTKELLPTAHRYDPEDTVVTYCFIFGMFIMAISLVLFVM